MHHRPLPLIAAAVVALLGVCGWAQEEDRGREPAPVMSYRGAPWLERPEREIEEQPDRVIHAMNLQNGQTVVDMGCGTGYYARRMAPHVAPDGKVIGVDVQPEMLDIMMKLCEEEGVTNVEPRLGTTTDPKLDPKSVDWLIMVDVYHEFQEPEPMLAEIRKALKDDGKVALLEYRLDGDTAAHIKPDHRMSVPQVLKEWNAAGFELVNLMEFLPSQHYFIFMKDPDRDQ